MRKKTLSWLLAAGMAISLLTVSPAPASAVDDMLPYATDVSIHGDAMADNTLTGSYTYNSSSGNLENGSAFRWLKSGDPVELFTNYGYTPDGASGPTADTVFILGEESYITGVKTYHSGDYNEPGTIGLLDESGVMYGPWDAVRAESYTTFYWLVSPDIVLPAGTYTVIDSRPETWTYNTLSSDQGHAWVYGNGFSAIAEETGSSYTPTFNDYLDCICFEVTVMDEIGNTGVPVRAYSDPIIAYWGDLVNEVGQYPFAGGEGSEQDPYLISTPLQLAQLAFDTAQDMDYRNTYFKQTEDIDLGGLQWNPIGASASEEFMGCFDGNNMTIRNLTIGTSEAASDLEEAGLFGYVSHAEIHNIHIEEASIYSALPDYYGEVGVLAAEVNSSLIHHCSTAGTIQAYSYSGSYVGGLVGKMDYYAEGIIACSSAVNITVSSSSSGDIGGLVGETYSPLIGCSASGSVSGYGYLGGLAGNSTDDVIDCSASGAVTSSYMAGGLVGYHDGTILNSYASGSVNGYYYAGGLVGFNSYYAEVKNSFATGNVSAGYAGGEAGGLIGSCCGNVMNSYAAGQATYGQGLLDYLYPGSSYPAAIAADCYWNSSLNAAGGAGTGMTTEEMQAAAFVEVLNDELAAGRDASYRIWKTEPGVNNNMPVLEGVGLGMNGAPPVISSAVGCHNLAAEAEVSFVSSALGQFFYAAVPAGADAPEINTDGSGTLCYRGANEFALSTASGAWDVYVIMKDTAGILSTPVLIELAEEPALFAGGSGTEADPYQIVNAYHLHNVRYFLDDCFILMDDVNLDPDLIGDAFWYDSEMGWKAIGSNDLTEATFTGDFEGNGKKISNMTITFSDPSGYSPGYVGLFGYVNTSASIRNVGVESVSISCTHSSGGAGGLAASLYGTVDHCYATGSISIGSNTAGGLVGSNNTATITNSWADVNIQSTGWNYVGGLTGFNNGTIRNCAATGNIQAGSGPRAGGLTGNNYAYTWEADIQNCYAAGDVSGSGWGYVGAFYGENYETYPGTAFGDCYWNEDATITATEEGGYSPTVHGSSAQCLAVDASYMKSQAFVDALNAGLPDITGYYQWEIVPELNGGYPIPWSEPTGDSTSPEVSDQMITASGITKSSVSLSWNGASDDVTDGLDLLYAVYRSSSDNISSVSAMEENGTFLTGFSPINTYTASGLNPGTTYYFNVMVKDEAGNKTAYQTKTITTLSAGGGGGTTAVYYIINANAGAGGSIAPAGASNVQEYQSIAYSINPDPGYLIGDVFVDGVSVGPVARYEFSDMAGDHRIEARFQQTEARFTDVDRTLWYREGIDFVLTKGLFAGTSETTFEPNTHMTRAMLVTVLWRLENEPDASSAGRFPDVAAGAWYAQAVAWAAENNIVSGYDENTFGPNDPITREQIAAIMNRYASRKGYDTAAKADLSAFIDAGKTSGWARSAMEWAVAEGLIKGVSGAGLDPAGFATRAQVATILMRFVHNLVA